MTSEVVVMNRFGVALAADSAVTIGKSDSAKVRDSAVKLFALSKYRPVGVMVYNNSFLVGVPWETIIKLFRRDLGRKAFGTLGEYGDALIRFVQRNQAQLPSHVQDRYLLSALGNEYLGIRESIRRAIEDALHGDDLAEFVNRMIAERARWWRGQPDANYFSEVRAEDVLDGNSAGINDVVQRVFAGWPVSSEGVQYLREIAECLVRKDYFPLDVFSGLVIAGFGEGEHFPVVQHIEVGGVYRDRLKVRPYSIQRVSDELPSLVKPFAYHDMVTAFASGILPSVLKQLENAVIYIEEMPVLALNAVTGLATSEKERLAEIVRRASAQKASEFAGKVLQASSARVNDIATTVETLTIKELAHVASTLVGLNSFGQQMSMDQETVGGPVDVAVISKGDGFIWIDRKHYFRKELNDHFFRNYYDEVVGVDDTRGASEEEAQDDA